jgi:hypothetical protein
MMAVPGTSTGRTGSAAEPDRRPAARAARGKAPRAALPPADGFWLVAAVLFLLFFGQPDLPRALSQQLRVVLTLRLTGSRRSRRS